MKVLAVGNPQGIKGHISDGRITALENNRMIGKSFINTKDGKIVSVQLKKPHKIIILKGKNAQYEINNVSLDTNYSYKMENSITDADSKIIVIEAR